MADTKGYVRAAFPALPKRDRLMLLLNTLGQMPVQEIAVPMHRGRKNAEAIITAA